MEHRVVILWTDTAKSQLAKLPPKVRKGLLDKADRLQTCEDPRKAHKPLVGPLEGYYRLTYSRYRAVYSVENERIASGDVLVHIRVCFIAAGKRKEHDKNDIYRIAEKFVQLGLINDLSTEENESP